jgi:roadblock/LC7 domain-containing protein
MATWTPIDTTTAPTSYDFNPFANFAYAEGTFADGVIYPDWGLINTSQSSNWGVIDTEATGTGYDFNPFANFAYAEGTFADGVVYATWNLIPTS